MNEDIKTTLKKHQKLIDQRLVIFFDEKERELKKVSDLAVKMCREIRDFTLRDGKRLRPILVYYGYLAGHGKNKKAILDASIFAELSHSYLLIHDDIIDRDKIRRGGPTMHKSYEQKYAKTAKNSEYLGISGAIMAGDLASAFAYEILTDSKFSPVLKEKAVKKMNQVLSDVICGETMDIFAGLNSGIKKGDILKILEYKTARYTIEGPLYIGAILAGAPENILKILSQFAIPLGIAFQLKDDILGMFGNMKVTGKSASSDIKEGKRTLLIVETLRLADKKQKKEIFKALGDPNATEKQLKNVREIIKNTGALDKISRKATEFAARASGIIEKSDLAKEIKQFLIGMSDYILEREK